MRNKGHSICGVFSKTAGHAQQLAVELNAQQYDEIEAIVPNADAYIVAISDDAIMGFAARIKLPGKLVVHTSGSVSTEVLKNMSDNYGVLYPLQSLRKQASHQPVIPFLIDGSNDYTKQQLHSLAASISPMVEEANDEARLKLHLAAVIASNFTNHLYSLAEDFCLRQHVPFKILVPLIMEVAGRAENYSPTAMQTGPAARGDMQTIKKHLQLLEDYPLLQNIYKVMSGSIMEFYGSKGQ
jgi:predicted short-subunit dehydrogenase-like oxidoreductase (DUF2520 family)